MKESLNIMKMNNEVRIKENSIEIETHKTLIRSRIPILVAYVALVLVVVVALCVAVPATAWESNVGNSSYSIETVSHNVSAEAAVPQVSINTIVTEEGPVEVALPEYEESVNPDTNWFDKVCDWVSGVFGG